MELKLINSKEEFEKHKKDLDEQGERGKPYCYQHYDDPERFPCMVHSHWWDDPNGPYCYDHQFVYLEDVIPLIEVCNKELIEQEFDTTVLTEGKLVR
jgi:hypothetical protein